MNLFLKLRFGRTPHQMIWMCGLLSAFVLAVRASAQTESLKTNWMPLPELLKKWESVQLPEIQKQAGNGDASAAHYLGYCYGQGFRATQNPNEALVWYQRALQAGYLPSANNIGLLYQRGLLGSSNNMDKAIYYYTYAADRGLDQSQANLGFLYRDGLGVPQDPKQAMHWFQLAAAQGHSTAMVEIGRLYRFGLGVESNTDEAIAWFEKAAKQKNSSLAQLNLGLIYQDQGELQKAVTFYEQAADQDSEDAMIQLYFCYWDGHGIPKDHAKAIEWLMKAANRGSPYAQCLFGYYYETRRWEGPDNNRRLTAPNWPQAFHWYRLSAEQNWAGGQYHLGMLYIRGRGVERDEARGLELVRAAADQCLDAACHDLAELYVAGIGAPRSDKDRPIELLRQSKSWEELISRYERGEGTGRDLVAAAECYCEAARAHVYWTYTLADKTEFHPGKPKGALTMRSTFDDYIEIQVPVPYEDGSDDLRRALSLYLKSAKGDGQAALQIGDRYLNGQDAPQSAVRAWVWFNVAQASSSEARAKLKDLESHMRPEEVQAAKEQYGRQIEQLRHVAAGISD